MVFYGFVEGVLRIPMVFYGFVEGVVRRPMVFYGMNKTCSFLVASTYNVVM